jgi:hypothetical protein
MHLAQVAGSNVSVDLKISAAALNEVLALTSPGGRAPIVEVIPGNVFVVRHGLFHAHAQLPAEIRPAEAPFLTLRLASRILGWTLRAVVHQPFMRIQGRDVTIALAQVPALEPWRDLWRHVARVTFATALGVVRTGAEIAVREPVAAMSAEAESPALPREHDMREWFQSQLAAGLPAFTGSTVTGTLVVQQELLNDLLARVLSESAARGEVLTAPLARGRALSALKSVVVRAEAGKLLVDFTIAV